MYILENGLPQEWNIFWIIIAIPLVYYSIKNLNDTLYEDDNIIPLMVLSIMSMVILVSLSIKYDNPLINANGIPTILLGFPNTGVITIISMIFIKSFSGLGGILSIGANIFSVAFSGPFIGNLTYKQLNKRIPQIKIINIAIAILLTEITSLLISCLQLSIAYNYPSIQELLVQYLHMYLLQYLPEFLLFIIIQTIICYVAFEYIDKFNNTS